MESEWVGPQHGFRRPESKEANIYLIIFATRRDIDTVAFKVRLNATY